MSSVEPALAAGIEEFNAGNYYEAHEIWEALWLEVVGEEKVCYQSLVQIAAGYHKLSIGEVSGARKLLQRGLQRLSAFGPAAYGIALEPFRSAVARDLGRLQQLPWGTAGDLSLVRAPQLRLEAADGAS